MGATLRTTSLGALLGGLALGAGAVGIALAPGCGGDADPASGPAGTAGAGGGGGGTGGVAGAGGQAGAGGDAAGAGGAGDAFLAGELLGRPTASSVALSVVPAVAIEAYVEVGTTADFGKQTPTSPHPAGEPFVVVVDGLASDTAYTYRLRWRRPGEATFAAGATRHFHTQRPSGATFRFTMQADSHLDENSDLALYHRTLANVEADAPDFHIDLGDTFMCEKHSEPLSATVQAAPDQTTVDVRYLYERAHFGLVAHSSPLFLVNGNHDGELGYLLGGAGNDLPTWTTKARKKYYLNPMPDGFYTGDEGDEPFVGERAAWYAWQWGDALFVALDPFWNTKTKTNADAWGWTLGQKQYAWLQQTLASSKAKYKFVFLHNLVGGLDGQMRGGVEAAPFFEWGGKSADGTLAFAEKRPGWAKPIHELLVDAKVTAVFHGHDHLYAKQELDGIVYQEVPQPSAKNTNNGAMLAKAYHYDAGTVLASTGHLRVTVSPSGVTGEYVRAWLPASETSSRKNGQVDDTWTIPAK